MLPETPARKIPRDLLDGEILVALLRRSTAPLQPPLPVSFSPRNHPTPSKLPTTQTQTNSSEGSRVVTTNSVPEKVSEKETWRADDFTDIDLKKKNRETIDECPICLEGMFCFYLHYKDSFS